MTSHEDYREWWLVFRDPTLNRLVEMAYAQNLTLMAAGARVIEARALLGEAIGEFYPQMQQVNGSATYLQPSETDATSNPDTVITARQFWRVNIGGEAAWELDLWGKFRRGVEQADAAYLASIASYDDVLVTLIGDVASDYLGMRTLEAQIAIARANVVKQQQALQIARDRFNGGPTSELDAFQAENVLAATQATIPQLTSQLLQTKNALGVLLGVPPSSVDALLSGSRGVPSPPRNVAVGIPADLLRRRADVRAAELRAEAQSAKVGIAAADLYPAFSLGGALGTLVSTTNGNKINQLFTPPSIAFAFGPSFNWPVFNYGQITNTVRAQNAKLQAMLLDYKNAVLKARREVENGLSGFQQGRRQAQRGCGEQSPYRRARSVSARNARLHHGPDGRTESRQTQNNLAAAQGNVSLSLTNAYRALGDGWQIREGNDFVNDANREEMRARTNYGVILPPSGQPQPATPGLPGPSDVGPTVRPPQW
jgi:NodT family efflux transporter outer membrane factor (OMF) lipoprotein